ncbi:MAG: type II toxin-antitoxin system VapC family toxin [Caulobacteraceae bacterium]
MTLVDSNVLIDILTRDPVWFAWSREKMEAAASAGPILFNEAVYAEISVGYATIERLDFALAEIGIAFAPTSRPALFLAGKAFQHYRARGGLRTGVLPDFFIGAHAALLGATLLTRDSGRYRTYFPSLDLIAP